MQIDLAPLVQRAGKTRQAELVLPAIVPPVGLERDLLTLYMRVVRQWGREASERIMPVYAATIGEGIRDAPADVEGATEEAEAALSRLVVLLGPQIEDWVVRVEQWHRGRLGQLLTPVGVRLDTLIGRGDAARTLEAVLAENVSLVRSLHDQMRNGISGAVFRGLQNRSTARDVAREIRKITGVARNRAELIAADQLQKLTGRLDQERQQQLGVKEFEWAHSRKKYPREHHKARDGQRFKWDSVVGRTDPPGRAIRCGCRARAVVKLLSDAETATGATVPVAKPEPPPPPPPARRGFRSPVNPATTDESIKVAPRLTIQKQLTAALQKNAAHPEYAKGAGIDRWGSRSDKDYGRASFSAAFDDETVSAIRDIIPELDDLADQIGIPRIRGYKSIAGTKHSANMGDGVMALNPTFFNGWADRVGGRKPGTGLEKIEAQRAAYKAQMEPLVAQLKELRAELEAIGTRSPEWGAKYDQLDVLRKELIKIRDKDDALWRKAQALKFTNKEGRTTSEWKPGDDVKARPFSTDAYFEGIDRARQTLYHEFGHHVHQMLKREGARKQYGPPPLERELRRMWGEVVRDRARWSRQPSKYGTTNEHEWFAENFAVFVLGRRDLVDPELLKLIERIFAREY